MPDLAFTKMHGLGNDFVVIQDLAEEWDLTPAAIMLLCERHFGIGADGVLIVRNPTSAEADYRMLYYNADGSQAEMCGNGVRCFAKYLVDRQMVAGDVLTIETLGGLKRVEVVRDYDGTMATATVDMGEPKLAPADIPTTLPGAQVYECPIETEYGTLRVTAVSMGNPHAVIWVDDVDETPVETIGPAVENHPAFPSKTNVEFAEVVGGGEDRIRLRVWERGVGETMACGTGACATLVAAVLGCRTERAATVELPGGELFVRWDEGDHVFMTGPAAEVFTGMLRVPEEDE
ncbi:MAG TPA: diaminopimelate epimerase [Coriobacteriia bacterium]|jgi:diaminopimelate epimerase